MTNFKNLVIEPLNLTHDRPGFQCGVEALVATLKSKPMKVILNGVDTNIFHPDLYKALGQKFSGIFTWHCHN